MAVEDTITGEQSKVRFIVLDAPTLTRPANFDTDALELPELTNTDMPVTVRTKTDQASTVYGSPQPGTEGSVKWDKPKPDGASWTMSGTGNVLPTEEERKAMNTMIAARGKYVWAERTMYTDAEAKGGCALVTSTGEPVQAGQVVTFTYGLTGYGPRYEDTKNII